MTPEQIKKIVGWLNSEAEQMTKDIHKYNNEHDYYNVAKTEGMRDAYLRCIKKLDTLKEQSESDK
jgi:hypothetical protein